MAVSPLRTLIAASLLVPLTLGLPGCSGGNEKTRDVVESGARGGIGGASGTSGNAGSMLTGNGGSTQGGASGSGTGGSAAFAGAAGAAGAGARGGSAGSGGGSGSGAQSGSAGQGDGGSAGAGACRKGSALPVGRCRTGADCGGGSICAPTLLTGGCGFVMPAHRDCETDTSCGDGRICVAAPPGSAPPCTMGTPTSCIDACSEDSCGDQVCGTDGRCRLATCEEGYTCSEGRVCRAGMTGTDARGCDVASCESDGYACPDTHHCAPQVGTADAHGCTPKTCSEDGWACPAGFVCSNPSSDVHGCACDSDDDCTGVDQVCKSGACVVKTCNSDDDCTCGVCANGVPGQCLPDFYYCAMLVP